MCCNSRENKSSNAEYTCIEVYKSFSAADLDVVGNIPIGPVHSVSTGKSWAAYTGAARQYSWQQEEPTQEAV